jgi:DNA repair protein RecO (recombination protein O)
MFTQHQTEGIILSTRKRREADEIFTLYTREFGKIDVIGRSIRKNGSKLKMNMSLFSLVKIGFIEGRNYNTLTDVNVVDGFKNVKKDLGKLSLFYRISEVVLSLIYEQEKDENIFLLLHESFKKINDSSFSKNRLKLFYCFFTFNLLYFLGYKMYIEKCAFCGDVIVKDCYFNSKEGGVVCKSCFSKRPTGIYLEDVELLKCFFENDLEKTFLQDTKVFITILENYLKFIPENNILYKKIN